MKLNNTYKFIFVITKLFYSYCKDIEKFNFEITKDEK